MRRKWTAEEEAYLLSKYLNQSVKTTAKNLKRTEASVKRKAAKLKLNHYLDNISAKAIAKCFGCDVSVVIRWIEKFGLPANKIKIRDFYRYSIDSMDFWEWANNNRSLINWSNYENHSLAPQPDWVQEEIKTNKTPRSRKRFNNFEKAEIEHLLRRGLTCEEVAEKIGRSLYSIRHVSRKTNKSNKNN